MAAQEVPQTPSESSSATSSAPESLSRRSPALPTLSRDTRALSTLVPPAAGMVILSFSMIELDFFHFYFINLHLSIPLSIYISKFQKLTLFRTLAG